MSGKRVHLRLVTEQPIPNAIPALLSNMRPDLIVLLNAPSAYDGHATGDQGPTQAAQGTGQPTGQAKP